MWKVHAIKTCDFHMSIFYVGCKKFLYMGEFKKEPQYVAQEYTPNEAKF